MVVGYTRRHDEGEAIAQELRQEGTRAVGAGVDVTSPEAVQGLVDRVIRGFGRVDILVNDAAYNKWIPFPQLQDLRQEDWRGFSA